MKTKPYRTKAGNMQFKPCLEELMTAVESDDNAGFCLACGDDAYGVEPDARQYQCERCDARKVYGCEQLLIMGLYFSDQGTPDNRKSHDYGDQSTDVQP